MKLKAMPEILAENPVHKFANDGSLEIIVNEDQRIVIPPTWFNYLGEEMPPFAHETILACFAKDPQ